MFAEASVGAKLYLTSSLHTFLAKFVMFVSISPLYLDAAGACIFQLSYCSEKVNFLETASLSVGAGCKHVSVCRIYIAVSSIAVSFIPMQEDCSALVNLWLNLQGCSLQVSPW